NSMLLDRLNDRLERLATMKAIAQLNSVDRRLTALFWHLAERWGRVTPDGVVVPLVLSHRLLGDLIGGPPPHSLDRARRARAGRKPDAARRRHVASHRRTDGHGGPDARPA